MKRFIVGAVMVAALAVPSAALAWRSNEFVSPSGNIQCEFLDYGSGITCMLANNRRQAVVAARGRGYEVRNWPDPFVTYQYVLRYGQTWTAERYTCRSFVSAMVCSNRWTGHGFSISRQGIRTW